MDTERIYLDRAEAERLYRTYKTHQNYSTPIDYEIQRAYQLLSKGKLVIRALESIKRAGVNSDHLPKLALAHATAKSCRLTRYKNGGALMVSDSPHARKPKNSWTFPEAAFTFPAETFPWSWDRKYRLDRQLHEAQLPIIPVHLRPKRGLENYHILWEAEWTPVPPVDPMLLRRIGKADLWLVVAQWDLTPVEQAALSTRIIG